MPELSDLDPNLRARFPLFSLSSLAVLPATLMPKASEHVGEIVALVQRLVDSGHAYAVDGDVAFHVPSYPEYGRLSLRDLDSQIVGARVARDVTDGGAFYHGEALLEMGLVDRALPLDEVLDEAVDHVRLVSGWSQEAFALIKRNRVEAVEAQVLANLEEKAQLFLERWYSDQARERLKEAMEKF